MTTDLNIANMALTKIGARLIASFEANSQEARTCSALLDQSRKAALRAYPWNFASKNQTLAAIDVPDGYEKWGYAYGYPSDYVRALAIHDGGGGEYPYDLAVYKNDAGSNVRIILTDLEAAYLNYTALITDPGLYDSQFIESFVLYLAKEISWPLTKKHSVESAMLQKYMLSVPKAQTADAEEQSSTKSPESTWYNDRIS